MRFDVPLIEAGDQPLLASVRQNDVMKKLAGWAAILAAVFGLYGMNFQGMP